MDAFSSLAWLQALRLLPWVRRGWRARLKCTLAMAICLIVGQLPYNYYVTILRCVRSSQDALEPRYDNTPGTNCCPRQYLAPGANWTGEKCWQDDNDEPSISSTLERRILWCWRAGFDLVRA